MPLVLRCTRSSMRNLLLQRSFPKSFLIYRWLSYATYHRESLAAFFAVLHFKSLIDGHSVTLFTDNKPIVSAFYSKNFAKSDHQQRQLPFLSEYLTAVDYIKSHNNLGADYLSRPVCHSSVAIVCNNSVDDLSCCLISAISVDIFDFHKLAIAQATEDEIESF